MAKTTRFTRALAVALFASLVLHINIADARGNAHRSTHRTHRAAAASRNAGPHYASVIMDAQTGVILDQQNANEALPPASLTKIMTLFLTFEALENGRLYMDKYLTVTANAVRQQPSKLGLKVGDRITVKQAILAVVTRSANDVAVALAETIGGSEPRFARMMTERARSLGMRHTYFANASGLPNPLQKSSAYDMAVLGRAMMQYFPQHYHFFSTKFFTYKGQIVTTHNNLMNRYKGMDGLKTGYTAASGFNLVSSAVRNNRRVIVAVFGGRSAVTRDNHVADLMDRGFDQLSRGQIPVQVANTQPAADDAEIPAVQVQQTTTTTTTRQTAQAAAPATAATTKTAVTTTVKTPASVTATTQIATAAGTTATATAIAPVTSSASNVASFAYPEPSSSRTAQTSDRPAPQQMQTASAQQLQPVPAPSTQQGIQQVSYLPTAMKSPNWGIQVGAYSTASLSQQALQIVQTRLKALVSSAQPVVVPSVTPQGTIYRARIIGMSAENAARACQLLSECMAFTVR